MKILLIGTGAREHAIASHLKASKNVEKIYHHSTNAGISKIAEFAGLNPQNHDEIIDFCQKNAIDLVFIGPEQPLVEGIVDSLQNASIKTFGPSKYCAQLEGSKDFMKQIASKNNIPTAKYKTFTEEKNTLEFAKTLGFPCVIKADGLAAGKGVVIAQNESEFQKTITEFFAGKFGDASKKIIIEEFLQGREVSHFAISDGQNYISLGFAQDHKKVGEGETGLNTGGMGTFCPSPFITDQLESEILQKIVEPTLNHFKNEQKPFTGILFSGIILTNQGPKLLEYNTRFGDPETQIILKRLKSDFAELIDKACQGKLNEYKIEFDEESKYVCVVMCAKGYPEKYQKNTEIKGLENIKEAEILHAGTKMENAKILANGGRVLNVISEGKTFSQARKKAYKNLEKIDWPEGFYRTDIAKDLD